MLKQFEDYSLPTLGYIRIPKIKISEEDKNSLNLSDATSSEDYLKALVERGFNQRIYDKEIPKDKIAIYRERLDFELSEINKLLFTDYILLVYHIIKFCKDNIILNSPGRGSCCGSEVLFVLGVTQIDAIKYDLLFSRFISAARTESKEINGKTYISSGMVPDVDIDSDQSLKYKVVEFIEQQFPNRTAPIINLSCFASRVTLKELLKIIEEIPDHETKEVTELIEAKFGKVQTIEEALNDNDEFKLWAENHTKVIQVAQKINGLIRNKSIHASGIIICENSLFETLPLELSSNKQIVCGYDMNSAQLFGIKIDNLGLKNLHSIKETLDMVGKKMSDIDINDEGIYKFINNSSDFYGLFQAEEGLGKNTLKRIKPTRFEDIAMSVALGRPGCMKFIDEIVTARETGEYRKYEPRIDEVLKNTYGTIIYQEQLMKLSQIMAGFDPKKADIVRKAVGKKLIDKMLALYPDFAAGCEKNGFSKELYDEIWQTFIDSGNYSFNHCIFEECSVETIEGKFVKLKDVSIGEQIKAYNTKTKEIEYVKILNKFHNKKPVYRVTLESFQEIVVSKDHKILTENGLTALQDIFWDSRLVYEEFHEIRLNEIYKIVYEGVRDTVDLEVDSKDHNFICNGIVVSNSHATAYGALTAITAYLKYHYPLEYFTALLNAAKEEQNPIEEQSKIFSELPNFGIKLLPPDLLKSDLNFAIEDKNIRFGLTSIKGIAEKTLVNLSRFKIDYNNKFQVFQAAKDCKISLGALCSMIQSGCLDSVRKTDSRSRLVLEACLWSILTDKEKSLIIPRGENNNYDLINILNKIKELKNEKGRLIVKESRLETIRKRFLPYHKIYHQNHKNEALASYYYEKTLTGCVFSCRLKELYDESRPGLLYINEVADSGMNRKVVFVGTVESFSGLKTSKNGKNTKYINLRVVDETGGIKVMMFNDKIGEMQELNGRHPKEDDIIIIKGIKKEDSIFADMISIQKNNIYMKLSELRENEKEIDTIV